MALRADARSTDRHLLFVPPARFLQPGRGSVNEGLTYRDGGRDYRLTDVKESVVREVLA